MDILEILDKLNIKYKKIEHKAVISVDDSDKIKYTIEGIICKTLFITDKKGNYYLYLLEGIKRANLKELSKILNTTHLSFASEEDLKNILKLERGNVTPFGIINNPNNNIKIILDTSLSGKKLLLHPNRNTASISIDFKDLIKFIEYEKNEFILI